MRGLGLACSSCLRPQRRQRPRSARVVAGWARVVSPFAATERAAKVAGASVAGLRPEVANSTVVAPVCGRVRWWQLASLLPGGWAARHRPQRAIARARSAPSPAPARQPPVPPKRSARAVATCPASSQPPSSQPPLRSPPRRGPLLREPAPRPTRDGHARAVPAPKRTRRGQRFFDVFRAAPALRFGDAVAPLIEVATSSVRRSRASRSPMSSRTSATRAGSTRPRSRIATRSA